MRIKIGSLEVLDVTLDEFDALVKRYALIEFTNMRAAPGEEPPVLGTILREGETIGGGGGATLPPDRGGPVPQADVAIIGGKKMTAKEVAEMRRRLAAPSPLPGIERE